MIQKTKTFTLSGTVLFPDSHLREGTLLIADGRIDRISPGRDAAADMHLDGTIVPGFIDLQVNGAYGRDFTNEASSVTYVAERLPATGVTAFLPTLITSDFSTYPARLGEIIAAVREIRTGAQILGVHLEGPYMNPLRKGAHPPAHIRPINVEEMRAWADPAVVRVVTLAPELEGALDAVRALRHAGIIVSAGHSDASYDQALAGFAVGINWGTHLYNAMSPLHHRDPGLMGALLTSTVPCGLIVDGIHMHPAMVKLAFTAKGPGQITLITDCMQAMGMPPGRFGLGDHAVIVDQDSARLENGTLAGSILRMDQAIRNMISFTGCSLAEAVCMASTTPAQLLGLSRKGAVAPGNDADLVVLSAQNEVTHTFACGELIYSRD